MFRVALKSKVILSAGAATILNTQAQAEIYTEWHTRQNWGFASEEEILLNKLASTTYGKLISRFKHRGKPLEVITYPGWHVTVVASPDEIRKGIR